MNHTLIKRVLKIGTTVAFVGIIVYQLYNIITNGGSLKKDDDDNEPTPTPSSDEDEDEDEDEDYNDVPPNNNDND